MEGNIYATPKSSITNAASDTAVKLIYSPTQVACGTIGGPVGLMYFLMSNFDTLGKNSSKTKTLIIGIASIIVLVIATPLLPENFPGTPFTVAYILIARMVAEKYQMTKADIIDSDSFDFHSNWRVFGYGILCLFGSLIAFSVPLFALILTGVWQP